MSKTEVKADSTKVLMMDEVQRPRKSLMQMLPWVLVAIIIVAAAIFFGVQYKKVQALNKQVSDLKANPNKAALDETNDVINKVGQLIVLPKGETPTLATVSDLSALKDQPFFANAEVGDKVLIYTNAKKAILYSPRLNKIKEVAPVNIGDNAAQTSAQPATTTPTKTPAKTTNTQANSQSNTPSNNSNK